MAVHADRPAADDDIAVGVYAVCVSRTHCDGDAAAGDLHSRDKGRRLARGIDAVARGSDRDVSAADEDIRSLNSLICRDVQRAAGDRDRLIRVDAVVRTEERKGTVTDEDRAVSVDGVVEGVNTIRSAADRDGVSGLDALEGFLRVYTARAASAAGDDTDVGIFGREDRLGLDAVFAGSDGERGICDRDKALFRVGVVIRANAVAARRDADGRTRELHGVLAAETDVLRVHSEILCRDHEVVLGDDRVLTVSVDRQTAGAVEREIGSAEDGRVQSGIIVSKRIGRAVGDHIDRTLCRGEEDLIRAADINRGAVFVGDRSVFQYELNLVFLTGFDNEHAFIMAGEEIGTG